MSSYLSGVVPGLKGTIGGASQNRYSGGSYVGVAPEATTVLYRPGDLFGELMAFASLLPIAICVALFTAFICRRTAQDLWVGGGQIANEILNSLIKIVLKVPRPHSPVINMPEDSYGMPSAHSQYMGYFSAVIIADCLVSTKLAWFRRLARVALVLSMSALTMFSRYYLHYHTPGQIFAGYFCGCAMACAWLLCGQLLRALGLMQWAIELWPCRLMLVKDESYNLETEYENYALGQEKKKL